MAREKQTTVRERIEFTRTLITQRRTKSFIKKALREYCRKPITARTVENYISRARGEMMEDIARGRMLLRSEAHAFYVTLLNDPKATIREKCLAQERIDKLLGLEDRTASNPIMEFLDGLPEELARPIRESLGNAVSRNRPTQSASTDDVPSRRTGETGGA